MDEDKYKFVTKGEDGRLRELTLEEKKSMQSKLPDSFFRSLNPEEEMQFRRWARDNFILDQPANPVWHPVVRDEWKKMQDMGEELRKEGYPDGKPLAE